MRDPKSCSEGLNYHAEHFRKLIFDRGIRDTSPGQITSVQQVITIKQDPGQD